MWEEIKRIWGYLSLKSKKNKHDNFNKFKIMWKSVVNNWAIKIIRNQNVGIIK